MRVIAMENKGTKNSHNDILLSLVNNQAEQMNLVEEWVTLTAPTDEVMAVLLDHAGLSRFFSAKFDEVVAANPGQVQGGEGAIRRVTTLGQQFDEQIVLAEPLRLHYRIIGEGPLRKHRGQIELTAHAQGTQLYYRIDGESANWVPTAAIAFVLRREIRQTLEKLRRHFAD